MRQVVLGLVVLAVAAAVTPAAATAQASGDCGFPLERTDATGTTVRIADRPDRVVTLNPSAAQTMREIGAWDQLVGATKYASNLEGFDQVQNISGAGSTVSNEEVVGLSPDLVLVPDANSDDTVETLRNAGLTVYNFREAETIGDVVDKTELTGRLLGECDGADETVAWMQDRLAVVDEAVQQADDRPRAIYVFFGYTSGENTFIDGIIERAGAENVAATAGIDGYKPVNEEVLVQQDPEWILLNTDWDEVPDTAAYDSTTAVQQNQTVVLNTNYLNRPGPRIIYPIEKLTNTFHRVQYFEADREQSTGGDGGDDYEPQATPNAQVGTDITPVTTRTPTPTPMPSTAEPTVVTTEQSTDAPVEQTAAPTETTEAAVGTTTARSSATETSSDTVGADGPGFGVLATVAALVLALLGSLVGRR